jgi:thymidylate synthase ThyX
MFNVLNHGYVRLVDSMGSDLSIVRSARVSYDAEWRAGEDAGKDAKLINYLLKNHHTSPFESVVFTFEVKAPIFVFRQWHRHRTWCLSGDSLLHFGSYSNTMTIKNFHDKWHGNKSKTDNIKKKPCYIENIDPKKTYTVKQLSELVDRGSPTILMSIRQGKLKATFNSAAGPRESKYYILGEDYINWAVSCREVKIPNNRKTLSEMPLLCYENNKISETRVVDIWISGEKTVYEVTVDKLSIKSSEDHLFLTDSGWMAVKDFKEETKLAVVDRVNNKEEFESFQLDDSKEEWKPTYCKGYEVSNYGRVRSFIGQGKRTVGAISKIKTLVGSRACVGFSNHKEGVKTLEQVSRLVYSAFIGEIPSGMFVCHKNDNPLDNRVENLYAGTAQDNADDAKRNNSYLKNKVIFKEITNIIEIGKETVYDLTVESDCHNFIASGFVVHNCFNEISARYSELPEEFYVPEEDKITGQSVSNKQQRTDEQLQNAGLIRSIIHDQCKGAFAIYHHLLQLGTPRELARGVLPVNTYSKMFATVDLHNLLGFIRLRDHSHAQYEIQVYAQAMLDLIEPIVPETIKAYRSLNV